MTFPHESFVPPLRQAILHADVALMLVGSLTAYSTFTRATALTSYMPPVSKSSLLDSRAGRRVIRQSVERVGSIGE